MAVCGAGSPAETGADDSVCGEQPLPQQVGGTTPYQPWVSADSAQLEGVYTFMQLGEKSSIVDKGMLWVREYIVVLLVYTILHNTFSI